MPINSKQKGKVGEREVVHLWAEYGFRMRRTAQCKGTPESADVEPEPNSENAVLIRELIHQEVKSTETFSVYKVMDQCYGDLEYLQEPVIFHRRKNRDWVVVIDARFFIRLFMVYLRFRQYPSLEATIKFADKLSEQFKLGI